MKWDWEKQGLFQIPIPWTGTLPELKKIFRYRQILTDIEKMERRRRRRESWIKFKKGTSI